MTPTDQMRCADDWSTASDAELRKYDSLGDSRLTLLWHHAVYSVWVRLPLWVDVLHWSVAWMLPSIGALRWEEEVVAPARKELARRSRMEEAKRDADPA